MIAKENGSDLRPDSRVPTGELVQSNNSKKLHF